MIKRKGLLTTILGLLITGVLIFSLIGVGGCGPKEEKVLKIGHLSAFSGPAAAFGWIIEPALEIAADQINAAGGIKVGNDNYMVEILKYDHQYNPDVLASVYRKAVYDDGVKYMIIMGGGVIPAVNDLIQKDKVVMFGLGGGTAWCGPDYPYTFRIMHDAGDNTDVMLQYIDKEQPGSHRVAVMEPDDDMGHAVMEDLLKVYKLHNYDVVYSGFIDRDAQDFYPLLTSVLAKNPDIIEFAVTVGQTGIFYKQARELGYKGIFIYHDGLDANGCAAISGWEAMEGTLNSPECVIMPTERGKAFKDEYTIRYGSWTTSPVISYDTLFLLKAAIEKANSLDTTKVMEELDKVSVEGCFGTLKFAGMGRVGANRLVTITVPVAQVINGKEVDVFAAFPNEWYKD